MTDSGKQGQTEYPRLLCRNFALFDKLLLMRDVLYIFDIHDIYYGEI